MSGQPERDPQLDDVERFLEAAARLESEAIHEAANTPRTPQESALVESFRSQLENRRSPGKVGGVATGTTRPPGPAFVLKRNSRLALTARIALAAAVILSATILLSRWFSDDESGSSASIHLTGDTLLGIVPPMFRDAVPETFECNSKLGDGAVYTFEFLDPTAAGPTAVILSRRTSEPKIVLKPEERSRIPRTFRLIVTGENEALGTGSHVASLDWSWR